MLGLLDIKLKSYWPAPPVNLESIKRAQQALGRQLRLARLEKEKGAVTVQQLESLRGQLGYLTAACNSIGYEFDTVQQAVFFVVMHSEDLGIAEFNDMPMLASSFAEYWQDQGLQGKSLESIIIAQGLLENEDLFVSAAIIAHMIDSGDLVAGDAFLEWITVGGTPERLANLYGKVEHILGKENDSWIAVKQYLQEHKIDIDGFSYMNLMGGDAGAELHLTPASIEANQRFDGKATNIDYLEYLNTQIQQVTCDSKDQLDFLWNLMGKSSLDYLVHGLALEVDGVALTDVQIARNKATTQFIQEKLETLSLKERQQFYIRNHNVEQLEMLVTIDVAKMLYEEHPWLAIKLNPDLLGQLSHSPDESNSIYNLADHIKDTEYSLLERMLSDVLYGLVYEVEDKKPDFICQVFLELIDKFDKDPELRFEMGGTAMVDAASRASHDIHDDLVKVAAGFKAKYHEKLIEIMKDDDMADALLLSRDRHFSRAGIQQLLQGFNASSDVPHDYFDKDSFNALFMRTRIECGDSVENICECMFDRYKQYGQDMYGASSFNDLSLIMGAFISEPGHQDSVILQKDLDRIVSEFVAYAKANGADFDKKLQEIKVYDGDIEDYIGEVSMLFASGDFEVKKELLGMLNRQIGGGGMSMGPVLFELIAKDDSLTLEQRQECIELVVKDIVEWASEYYQKISDYEEIIAKCFSVMQGGVLSEEIMALVNYLINSKGNSGPGTQIDETPTAFIERMQQKAAKMSSVHESSGEVPQPLTYKAELRGSSVDQEKDGPGHENGPQIRGHRSPK